MEDLAIYGLVPASEMAPGLAGAARALPLHNRDGTVRAWAMLDPEDFARLSIFNYSLGTNGYPRRRLAGGTYYPSLHRDVMGLTKGDPTDVDHINHDKLDNRRSNLRLCSRAENHQNRQTRAGGSSKHRGVSWDPSRGKWKAQGVLIYRNHFIGRFDAELEAAAAAAAWRAEHMPFSSN